MLLLCERVATIASRWRGRGPGDAPESANLDVVASKANRRPPLGLGGTVGPADSTGNSLAAAPAGWDHPSMVTAGCERGHGRWYSGRQSSPGDRRGSAQAEAEDVVPRNAGGAP